MSRWRDAKKGNIKPNQKKVKSVQNTPAQDESLASLPSRIKAFITDTFLITTPIVYITIYIIMGSGAGFSENKELGWLIILVVHFIIIMTFWLIKGQTPGLKAYEGKIVDCRSKKSISYLQAFVRYVITFLSIVSIFGMFFPFLRKDKKTIQDFLSNTCVIKELSE